MEKELRKLEQSSHTDPLYSYESDVFGHINYLKVQCEQLGIRCQVHSNSLLLFSKRKVPDFLSILNDSIRYVSTPDKEPLREETTYRKGESVLGVLIKEKHLFIPDANYLIMHLTERHVEMVVYYMFKKEIPKPQHFRVFGTKKEMEAFLEKHYSLYL